MSRFGMLNLLAEVLKENVGRTLTPELCAAIFGRVAHATERPLDISGVAAETHGRHVFACERLSTVLEDIKTLHIAHWEERGTRIEDGEFKPDYVKAIQSEVRGGLILCTVRYDGDLVGSVMAYLYRSMHTGELLCHEDSLFVRRDHRLGLVGPRLFDFFERAIQRVNVDEAEFSTDPANSVNRLLLRKGYTHSLNVYRKRFTHVQQSTAA